jgi:hypothetical protein
METFNVHVIFSNNETMVENHTSDTLVDALERLIRGPAARFNLIHEVKVVDSLDCTNFLFRDGKLLFPTKADLHS